jgi:glycosyltransferase involved in cell wall biosynthesis
MSSLPVLSIIVPVFNEARTVGSVVQRLLSVELPTEREIIVINDGSSDGTKEALDALPSDARLQVVHVSPNAGKGAAIRRGLTHATGSIVAIQDADLELDPAQLADLVRPILAGDATVVYGSRFLNGRPDAPVMTLAGNWFLTAATNLLFGSSITDMETCYKIMRTDVARSLGLESNRFDIEPEITAKVLLQGQRIHERPVHFKPRLQSEGKKIKWRDGVHALGVLLRCRFGAAARTATTPSSTPSV